MICNELQENLTLYLYEELTADQRPACDAHLADCASCRAALEELRGVHGLLRERLVHQPPPELLVQCRQALSDTIDREEMSWRGLFWAWLWKPSFWNPARRLTGIATLTLLVLGFGLGWTLRSRPMGVGPSTQGIASSSFLGSDLENVRIKDISRVAPDPRTGAVHITLDAERRLTLEGSLDDPHIQQVLVYALRNYNNPGIRRDTLDVLRSRSQSPNVRDALLYAMQSDPNAGVRLEALEMVQSMEWTPKVQQAMLNTLKHDTNSGARVEAINALIRHAGKEALPVLEKMAVNDPSRYVRIKCAAAIRELGGNDF